MTDINTIMDANWDVGICAKPTFVQLYKGNYRGYERVFGSEKININDEMIGIVDRSHYSPESHDAFKCKVASTTESDIENIIKGMKKVCTTFAPSSEENILQWQPLQDRYNHPSNCWFEYDFIILKRKAGIKAY